MLLGLASLYKQNQNSTICCCSAAAVQHIVNTEAVSRRCTLLCLCCASHMPQPTYRAFQLTGRFGHKDCLGTAASGPAALLKKHLYLLLRCIRCTELEQSLRFAVTSKKHMLPWRRHRLLIASPACLITHQDQVTVSQLHQSSC